MKPASRYGAFLAACFFAIVVVFPAGLAAKTARPCASSREEQEVYRVVLTSMGSAQNDVVETETENSHYARGFSLRDMLQRDVEERTAVQAKPQLDTAPPGSTLFLASPPPDFVAPSDKALRALEEDYREKLFATCRISKLPPSLGIRYITPEEEARMFRGTDLRRGWKRFHVRYGDQAVGVSLSRVAFDHDRTFAMVQVSSGISEMGGEGMLYLLKRQDGQWTVIWSHETWVT